MGADFVMLGRYFARFDESPSDKVNVNGTLMKEYWGEGSNRARNWTIRELQEKARLTLVSSVSIVEGGAHDVVLKTSNKQV